MECKYPVDICVYTSTHFWPLPLQPPVSSSDRPPVMHYSVHHNVTGTESVMTTTERSITLLGGAGWHAYFVKISAVNVIGEGPSEEITGKKSKVT